MTVVYRKEAKIGTNTSRYYSDSVNYDIDHMTLKKLEDIREAAMVNRNNISPEWSAKISKLIGLRQAVDNTDSLIKEIRNDIKRIEDERKTKDRD